MRYDIRLSIDYTYAAPSDHTRNLLRLLPAEIPDMQRVERRFLSLSPPPDERHDYRDFFGNASASATWHRPIDTVALNVRARVERMTPALLLDLSPALDDLRHEIAEVQSLTATAPHHFRGASPRIPLHPEITAFAREAVSVGSSAFDAFTAIGRALHEEMRFDSEATTVDTTPAEAFTARHGVCQDFAQVMIAALRGMGIPAGYVSGFLRTFPPPGQPRLEGADAMHAWVRAWVGHDMGWVEFDPTNNQAAGLDYITVAVGRDYSDIAPVRGMMRTAGGHETRQAVDIVPVEEE